jgi:hypothetical protein
MIFFKNASYCCMIIGHTEIINTPKSDEDRY